MIANKMPQIRFKGFCGEWDAQELGDISEQISYGLTVRPKYIKVGIPLISARELKNGNINYTIAPKISVESYNELSEKAKAKKGDIFLTKTGTVGLSSYVSEDFLIAITQNIAVIRVVNKKYNHQFILQTFKTQNFYKTSISQVNQSTIMDLQLQDIRKLLVFFPNKQEQTKIANYLQNLDKLIEQKEKKHKKLGQLKKAMLEKMFPKDGENTPEIRFKGFSGEWEEKIYDDVFNKIENKKYQINSTEYFKNGKYPVIDQGQKKIISYSNKTSKVFSNNGIIIFGDHTRIIKYIDFNFIVGADGTQLLINKNTKDFILFLYYQLYYKKIPNTGYNRHFKFVKEMFFKLPLLAEQTKIGNYFQKLDKLIELQLQELEKLKNIKKASLDKMFV